MNIDDLVEDFSGSILISRGGVVHHDLSYGYRDRANRLPNTADTRYATASAGKVFVAVAILQLIERGRLDFDSQIGDLLDFDLGFIRRDVTIRQLLTHQSGVPDYFDEAIMEDYSELWQETPNYRIRHAKDLLPLFVHKPMQYEPGERFAYNNSGYVLLGLIIEALSASPFDSYLAEHVFNPCGMADTGYFELDRLPERCANAYIYDEARGEYYTNIYSIDVKGSGAGGAYTTVHDVLRFWEALYAGKLIGSHLDEMLSCQASDEEAGDYYGYGIWLLPLKTEGEAERTEAFSPFFQGSDPGVSFISIREPDGTILTIASNCEDNVWSLVSELRKRFRSA